MRLLRTKLPEYFYSITHPVRWYDPYASPDGTERMVLTPAEIKERGRRNEAYAKWIARSNPPLKGKHPIWQAIQILSFKHSEHSHRDWWENYQDALFRAYVQPETVYDFQTGENKQWYLLCPEDCFLINKYEIEKNGPDLPPRNLITEKYLPLDPKLRRRRLIPVECCRHWKHETTAGRLPEGL